MILKALNGPCPIYFKIHSNLDPIDRCVVSNFDFITLWFERHNLDILVRMRHEYDAVRRAA